MKFKMKIMVIVVVVVIIIIIIIIIITMASDHQSLVKEAAKYAAELNITLQLDILNPVCVTTEGKVVTAARAGNLLKQSQEKQFLEIAKTKSGKESYSVSDGKMRA